ncbi:hypothetical protein VTN00DRAFT_1030 [Thermoascus crustaceus]|uniref:uncharacterized protein n=1 Tax=Thermoascus crustaceus TaxID=5088 RepID=UPI00374245A1
MSVVPPGQPVAKSRNLFTPCSGTLVPERRGQSPTQQTRSAACLNHPLGSVARLVFCHPGDRMWSPTTDRSVRVAGNCTTRRSSWLAAFDARYMHTG